MSFLLSECQVIGGAQALDHEVPFARASPVLRRAGGPGGILVARRFVTVESGGQAAEGSELDEGEWAGLVAGNDAFALREPVPLGVPATFYLLGRGLSDDPARLDALRAVEAVLHVEAQRDVTIALIRPERASAVRARWGSQSYDQARTALLEGHVALALDLSYCAFHLDGAAAARRWGLVAAAHRAAGNFDEAESWLAMAANSHGKPFAEEVSRHMGEIGPAYAPPKGSAHRADADGRRRAHLEAALAKLPRPAA